MKRCKVKMPNPVVFLKPALLLTCCKPFLNLFKNFFPVKRFLFHLCNLNLNLFQDTRGVDGSYTKEKKPSDKQGQLDGL